MDRYRQMSSCLPMTAVTMDTTHNGGCNHGYHTMEALCAAIMSPGAVMDGDGG